ncbi:MAG: hypothetical protein ABI609_08160 [Acidobacteriota bacterium]
MRLPSVAAFVLLAVLHAFALSGAATAAPHWVPTSPFTTGVVTALAVTPAGPSLLIAFVVDPVFPTTRTAVFRSADRGETWTKVFSDPRGPYDFRGFDPRFPRTLYAFGTNGKAILLFKSTLAGRSWRKLLVPFDCLGEDSLCETFLNAFAIDPAHPDTLFVAGTDFMHFVGPGDFFLRSSNDFHDSQPLPHPAPLFGLEINPLIPHVFYGLSCSGVYQSLDASSTWRRVGAGLPLNLCTGSEPLMRQDPQRPGFLYVAVKNGLFVSSNGGRTFIPFNAGLESETINSLLIDPTNAAKLYVGIVRKGVYQWNARLQRWMPLNGGLPIDNFTGTLALDARHPAVLYAGTESQGVFRLESK